MEYSEWWAPFRVDKDLKKRAERMLARYNLKTSEFTRTAVELYTALLEEKERETNEK